MKLSYTQTLHLLIVSICLLALPTQATAQVEQPADSRDTIVIVQRDTVILVKKDTVFFEQVNRDRDARSESADRLEQLRDERIALREQRRREYQEWVDAQPIVRVKGVSYAYKYYPTQLLLVDFPTIGFGLERTVDGKFALEGQFGFVTRPIPTNDWGGFEPGTARFGVRGVRVAVGGRVYFGEPYKRFPFYLGGDLSYAITPVNIELWVPSDNGQFDQFVDAPVNGYSTTLSGYTGWQLRSKDGLVVDFSTGLALGVKGIRSKNEFVQEAIEDEYWNLFNNNRTVYGGLVLRIGIGFGDWQPKVSAAKSRNSRSRSSKSRSRSSRGRQ